MMPFSDVLILGCGFVGQRVAAKLLDRGVRVLATNRVVSPIAGVTVLPLDVNDERSLANFSEKIQPGLTVVHCIPLLQYGSGLHDPTPAILGAFEDRLPVRVLYLSSTSVYGASRIINERTPPAPRTPREILRLHAERAVAAGPWSSLILRPAAIYGPGRGVHESMRHGTFRVPEGGGGSISRIHVDDVAEIVIEGLLSSVTGAFPVADEHPCPSLEVAEFCATALGFPTPCAAPLELLNETLRNDRRVDGSAIRRLLGLDLRYPSYREGIPACLAEEAAQPVA
jgi:nucleoside-diphosphate-sugar epimerase